MVSENVTTNNLGEQNKEQSHLLANPQFWSIVIIFVLITLHHYDNLTSFRLFSTPDLPLGITRHTIDRILYLVPIILSSLIFGSKGGKITLGFAVIAMLPRAIFISLSPITSLWETAIVTLIGSLAPVALDHYRKQEQQLEATMERLESTERELHFKVQLSIEQERQLSVINTFSAMLSQTLDLEHVMDATADMVMGVMQVDAVIIFSLEQETETLRVVAYSGMQPESVLKLNGLKIGEGLTGHVAKTGQPLVVEDVYSDPTHCNLPVIVEHLKSELCVPLLAHGKIMGTLFVASRSYRDFKGADIEMLSALGNLIGVAMRNASLYKDREAATTQLQVSEKRYRKLFENAHDAIWVQDLSGIITAANQAAAELFGCNLDELVGSDSKEFLVKTESMLTKEMQQGFADGDTEQDPYRKKIVKKDRSEAIVMLTTSPISNNGQIDGFQFIGRDITKEVRMQENQSFYLQQVTQAHEDERQRISRDLHDSTAQNLIAMLRQLEKFAEENIELPEEKRSFLWSLHKQIKGTLHEIRQLSRDLRPSVLDNLGLLPAVEWLVEQLKTEQNIDARLTVLGNERRFSQELEITMFRIIQEALRNIGRHAEAGKVDVTIDLTGSEIKITVTDNGKGFKVPTTLSDLSRYGKLGIDGMRTRARLAGGTFDIRSKPGRGTKITVIIPA